MKHYLPEIHADPNRSCTGFTLLEVLVAVVILSIGMLGLMGLQTVALRQNNSAQTRSYAIDYINELVDRMRANRPGVDANFYHADPTPGPISTAPSLPSDPGFDCINTYPAEATGCNPQQIAQIDLYTWKNSANFVFPGSQATVTCTDSGDPGFSDAANDGINDADTDGDVCTDGSLFVVSLSWDDDRTGNSPVIYKVTFVP